jgi:serine/threonine protein phosphatase PrpC
MSLQLQAGALTDVGRERAENQDAIGHTRIPGASVWYVCDGMGGHLGGSTASRLAIEGIDETLKQTHDSLHDAIDAAMQEANRRIHQMSTSRRELHNMGTTAVLVAIEDSGNVIVAHVGDSRAYLLRDNTIRQLTRDHTMVQRLVDDGVIEPEAAENHPHSNYISRSLGGREAVDVEFNPEPITTVDGDIFMLCSDGLHGLVKEPDMAVTMRAMPPEDSAAQLIDMANEAGGHDNISVQVVLHGPMPGPLERDNVIHERPPRLFRPTPVAEEHVDVSETPHEGLSLQDPAPAAAPAAAPAPAEPDADQNSDDDHVLAAIVAACAVIAVVFYFMIRVV